MTSTSRLFRRSKQVKLTNSGTTDALMAFPDGTFKFDLSDISWERIVLEYNITAITGTVAFKVLTTNDDNNGGATTDVAAVGADGSTAFASAATNATGRGIVAIAKRKADGSACSNVGKWLEIFRDGSTLSALTADLYLYVEGA